LTTTGLLMEAAIPHRGGQGRESLKIRRISKGDFLGMAAFKQKRQSALYQ